MQYWLVGAMRGGSDELLPTFIERGYWYCWDVKDIKTQNQVLASVKTQRERLKKIYKGDRIAVKRLLGKGASEMSILALGIVKSVDFDEWRVYVDWVLTDIRDRRVALKGCAASIHGPFDNKGNDATWVNQIFSL